MITMENYLQIADHWVTIVSGVFTIILAGVATWLAWKTHVLTKHDKQKTIAINELQLQTKKLEELYLYQIQPKFVTKPGGGGYLKVINIGGDCYNLQVSPIEGLFENFNEFFSSHSEKNIASRSENILYELKFEDSLGNKLSQTYHPRFSKFSNLKKLNVTNYK